jgi:hypothetical protein
MIEYDKNEKYDKYDKTKHFSKLERIDEVYDSDFDSMTETTVEDGEYQFESVMCPNLAKLLGYKAPEYKETKMIEWQPPKKWGLENCNVIIPNYYVNSYEKIIDIDYFTIIKDNVKNCRPLTDYQIEYVMNMPDYEKNELIMLYNECTKMYNEYFSI